MTATRRSSRAEHRRNRLTSQGGRWRRKLATWLLLAIVREYWTFFAWSGLRRRRNSCTLTSRVNGQSFLPVGGLGFSPVAATWFSPTAAR